MAEDVVEEKDYLTQLKEFHAYMMGRFEVLEKLIREGANA